VLNSHCLLFAWLPRQNSDDARTAQCLSGTPLQCWHLQTHCHYVVCALWLMQYVLSASVHITHCKLQQYIVIPNSKACKTGGSISLDNHCRNEQFQRRADLMMQLKQTGFCTTVFSISHPVTLKTSLAPCPYHPQSPQNSTRSPSEESSSLLSAGVSSVLTKPRLYIHHIR